MPENIHDKGYKRILSKKENFLGMLNGFVDEEWVSKIDGNALELIDKEFILKDFRDKEADIIYRLKLNNMDIIFYCLLELQSTVDYTMPFRLLIYIVELLKRIFFDEDEKKRERVSYRLPVIIPIVLYNGGEKWTAVKNFKEYQSGYEMFGNYPINFSYKLLNVNQYTDEELKEVGNLISAVFSLDKEQPLDSFIKSFHEAAEIFMKLKPDEQIDFMDWLKDVLSKKVSLGKKSIVNEMILNLEKGSENEMTYAIERFLDKIEQEGMRKGLEEGREEGREEGIEKGIEKGLEKGKLEAAINIIKELNTTVTKAMEVTKLSDNAREKIIMELKRQNIRYTN